jgi:hypothetical protein
MLMEAPTTGSWFSPDLNVNCVPATIEGGCSDGPVGGELFSPHPGLIAAQIK